MPIALPHLAHSRRFDGAGCGSSSCFTSSSDRVANPQPHRHLDAVGAERRNLFLLAWLLGTELHRAILPAPAAKRARSSCVELRRMMTRFLLFHQTHTATSQLGTRASSREAFLNRGSLLTIYHSTYTMTDLGPRRPGWSRAACHETARSRRPSTTVEIWRCFAGALLYSRASGSARASRAERAHTCERDAFAISSPRERR